MFLILPDASDEEITKVVGTCEGYVTDNGAVHVETLNRGRQPLAYLIQVWCMFDTVSF